MALNEISRASKCLQLPSILAGEPPVPSFPIQDSSSSRNTSPLPPSLPSQAPGSPPPGMEVHLWVPCPSVLRHELLSRLWARCLTLSCTSCELQGVWAWVRLVYCSAQRRLKKILCDTSDTLESYFPRLHLTNSYMAHTRYLLVIVIS